MAILEYAISPAHKASWRFVFYDGSLPVVNGRVETDSQTRIDILRANGFKIVSETVVEDAPITEEGTEDSGDDVPDTVEEGETHDE